jgi:hypothetical protein
VLVVVDAFTKYTWLFATKSTGTQEVVNHMKGLFGMFGALRRVISNRRTAFTSQVFTQCLNTFNIKHIQVAVASPWANGQAERVNRFLKSTLAKLVNSPNEWRTKLIDAQYVLNNTFHKAINTTPNKLLLGYDQRNHTDRDLQWKIKALLEIDEDLDKQRATLRDCAQEANRNLQLYNKAKYDKKHKKPTLYQPGDLVMIRNMSVKPGINQKLLPKFRGPYQVKRALNKNRYVITDVPGYQLTNKPYNSILSTDKIKPWIRIPTVEKNEHVN